MNYKKITALMLAVFQIFILSSCASKTAAGTAPAISKEGKTLILHTNDMHGRVVATEQSIGISALKALKDRYKTQGMNVILLDAGDTFHGSAFATLEEGKSVLDLMTLAGYDAIAPGNHDFNYGSAHLGGLSFQTPIPMLSANILKKGTDKKLLDSYAVVQRENIKIGVFGLSTPETEYKTNPVNVETLEFYDPYAAAAEAVSVLKAAEVDFIIALCHLGLNSGSAYTSEGLAKSVAGIDLIVDGHSHTLLEQGKKVGNTLIVSAGEYMQAVGVVTLEHATRSVTAEVIKAGDARLQGLSDPEIDAKINEISLGQQQILSQVLGHTPIELVGERAAVRTGETNLGDVITDAMRAESGAEIALLNSGSIRASIPEGDITKGNIIDVLPFGNYIITKKLNGSNLRAALENAVKVLPEENGAFLQVSGLTFAVDQTSPAGGRIRDVLVNGKPLDIAAEYVVAVNDFLAAGGDDFAMIGKAETLGEFSSLDEALMRHINEMFENDALLLNDSARISMSKITSEQKTEPVETLEPEAPVPETSEPEVPDAKPETASAKPKAPDKDAASSSFAPAVTAEPDEDGYIYYIVDYDDNIWNIAKEQLGDVNMWDEILAANRDIITDQDHIYVGQRLRLPKKAS